MRTYARHITTRQAIICLMRLKLVQNRRKNSRARQKNASVSAATDCRRLLLQVAAETLTSYQYQVFVLCCLESLTQREIAAILDVSPSAVSQCLRAARLKMRRVLGFAPPVPTEQDYDYDYDY